MNKSITSLYRRYRPTKFSDVIAQTHVTKTLENQIKNNTVTHAYLFCGTRGTGKTSVAKIFAKAVSGNTPDPTLDIFEIDAASNNRVEDIRELIEKTKYPPTFSKYKVYIIDEVHMFSASAFNAFLKTLEEPPSHVIFILCTTEPHKLPQTILSRVLRFDFRPVAQAELEKFLSDILKKEGISAAPGAITMISKAGNGSVRDVLSVAESVIAYSKTVSEKEVEYVLGTVSGDKLELLAKAVLTFDIDGITKLNQEIFSKGVNISSVCRDFLATLRQMFGTTKNSKIMQIYKIFAETELNLKTSLDPRGMFEGGCFIAAGSLQGPQQAH